MGNKWEKKDKKKSRKRKTKNERHLGSTVGRGYFHKTGIKEIQRGRLWV